MSFNLASVVSRMPHSLRILFFMLLIIPFWSMTFLDWPWEIAKSRGLPTAMLLTFAYWIGPILTCVMLALRSFALLHVFGLECLALIGHVILDQGAAPGEMQALRFALLGVMVVVGVLVINRDAIYPLMTKRKRFWRKSSRIYANTRVRIIGEESKKVSALLVDCSLTGIGLSVNRGDLLATVGPRARGDKLVVEASTRAGKIQIACHTEWTRDEGDMLQIGASSQDEQAMTQLMESLANYSAAAATRGTSGKIRRLWSTTAFRRAALTLWGLSIAGSFGVPACGTQHDKSNVRTFGGTAETAEAPKQQDLIASSQRSQGTQPAPQAVFASGDHGFGLAGDGPQPASTSTLAFTGRSLHYGDCGPGSLAADFSQARLLERFQGSNDWFGSAISSLEESHDRGVYRPNSVLHKGLRDRLGAGRVADSKYWSLNLVRLRTNGKISTIKLNYELDVWSASAHATLQSVSLIHAIAIPESSRQDFVDDINALPSNPQQVGCALKTMLEKWLTAGSYWFLHTNILDESFGPSQWMWTEHLVFEDEPASFSPGCAEFGCGSMAGTSAGAMESPDPFGGGEGDFGFAGSGMPDGDGDKVADANDKCPQLGDLGAGVDASGCPYKPRRWVGAHGSPSGAGAAGRKLTITPMEFQKFKWNPSSKSLESLGEADKVRIWFSGNLADHSIDLVVGPNGEKLPRDHVARQEEEAHTCSSCHAQRSTPTVVDGRLADAPAMDFRMVGYGTRRHFGQTRPFNRASLSPYLMATAIPGNQSGVVNYGTLDNGLGADKFCTPFGGCQSCDSHQHYKLCLVDAADLIHLNTDIGRGLVIQFPTLKQDLAKHAAACISDVNSNLELATQCEFLRCAEFRARRGDALAANSSYAAVVGPHNNPTFGCDMDEPFNPFRPVAQEGGF